MKPKVKTAVQVAAKKRNTFSVNVARMDRYLSETREEFIERLRRAQTTESKVRGALAGPVRSSRPR